MHPQSTTPRGSELRNCLHCGATFRNYASRNRLYCGMACYRAALPARVTRACVACGATFWTYPSRVTAGSRQHCSTACASVPKRGRGTAPLTRFLAKVEYEAPGCWVWQASTDEKGYGQFFPTKGQRMHAYKWAYEYFVGPVPDGLHLDHLCRVHRCVNPDHLRAVTPYENWRVGASPTAIAARRTHCSHGHAWDAENTRWVGGKRRCVACARANGEVYRAGLHARTPEGQAMRLMCRKGHGLTADNVYWWRGHKGCRTCRRNADARRTLKRRKA
jgi:hypothetical protein